MITKKPQPCLSTAQIKPKQTKTIFYAFRYHFMKYQHIKILLHNKWRTDCYLRQNASELPYCLPEVFHMVFHSRKADRMLQCIQVSQGLCGGSPVHICGRSVFMQCKTSRNNPSTTMRDTQRSQRCFHI